MSCSKADRNSDRLEMIAHRFCSWKFRGNGVTYFISTLVQTLLVYFISVFLVIDWHMEIRHQLGYLTLKIAVSNGTGICNLIG